MSRQDWGVLARVIIACMAGALVALAVNLAAEVIYRRWS